MRTQVVCLALAGLVCAWASGLAQAAKAPVQVGDGNAVIIEKDGQLAGAFTYQLVIGQFYEWNTDPTAVPGILGELARRTNVKAAVEFKSVGLDDPQIFRNPLLIMTGNHVFRLSQEEIANLRLYLQRGGFLYADDCGGADGSFRRMIAAILPDAELQPIAADHPVIKEFYPMPAVPKVVDLYGGPAEALGVVRNGRLVVVYTHDTDLPCAWERYPNGTYVHVIDEAKREEAMRFGVNVILHALRQQLREKSAPVRAFATPALPAATPLPVGAFMGYSIRRQLPSTHITAMAASAEHVWFGGFSFLPGDDEGLARYEKRTGKWRVFMDAEGVLSEEINCLAMLDEKVLVGSDTWKWTKGMATFDPTTGRWSTLNSAKGLPHDRVVAILPDEDRLWIACRQGLAVRNNDEDHATVIQDPVFPTDEGFLLGLMRGGRFVWANHASGVACFDKQSGKWSDLAKRTPLLPRQALAMACGSNTAWFLSPVNAHIKLVRFDIESEIFSEWPAPESVPMDQAFSLATDGQELLIGMRDNLGIYAFNLLDGALIRKWKIPSVASDRSLLVGKMLFDEGVVWAALWPNGGLWRRDAKTRNWQEVPYRAGSPASHILSLTRVGDQLYVGSSGAGLWRYDLAQRAWVNLNLRLMQYGQRYSYLGDHEAIKWDTLYALAPEGRRVWMGTNHGLALHDPEQTPSGFETIEPAGGGIVKGLAVADGLIWVGGDDGKIRAYDPNTRAWKDGLVWSANSPVRALCLWQDVLWAATAKGLYSRSIGADGAWVPEKTNAALVDLQGLWPATNGLWIASREALYLLRKAGQTPQEITQSRAWVPIHGVYSLPDATLVASDHGLLVCDSNQTLRAFYNRDSGLSSPIVSALEADDQNLWLGTLGGGLARIKIAALWPEKPEKMGTEND
jgi:ligand-binding sensor domain-containing protein